MDCKLNSVNAELIECITDHVFVVVGCSCPEKAVTIYPADVVLFEGILVFYFQSIRDLFHMKLFVDTDSDTRLARRGALIEFNNVILMIDKCVFSFFKFHGTSRSVAVIWIRF